MKVVETAQAIQSLTLDEDERQELWIRCLEEGDDVGALSTYLADIRKNFSEEELLQVTLWKRVFNTKESELLHLFDQFTDLEQAVMRLLALGTTLQDISGITAINTVRLDHIISVVREHDAWKSLYDNLSKEDEIGS